MHHGLGSCLPKNNSHLARHNDVLLCHAGGKSCEKLEASSSPLITDVDSNHKDPLMCSLYAPDIYSNLRVMEVCITSNLPLPFNTSSCCLTVYLPMITNSLF